MAPAPEPPASWRPLSAAAPAPARVWAEGAGDKEAARRREERGPCHAEAARPRAGKAGTATAFPLQRKRACRRRLRSLRMGPPGPAAGGPRPDLPPRRGSGPRLAGWGGGVRARPLLAVPLTAGPGRGITPARGPQCAPAANCRGSWAQLLGIPLGRQAELLSSHSRPALPLSWAS